MLNRRETLALIGAGTVSGLAHVSTVPDPRTLFTQHLERIPITVQPARLDLVDFDYRQLGLLHRVKAVVTLEWPPGIRSIQIEGSAPKLEDAIIAAANSMSEFLPGPTPQT